MCLSSRPGSSPGCWPLHFWYTHHPAGYYRSAAIFEDLARPDLARSKEDLDKDPYYLGRAMIAYFRALSFGRCAELARRIPADASITPGMRAWLRKLPKGWDLPSLRRLGTVADLARALPQESDDFHRLARFILDWQSLLRLQYTLVDQEQRRQASPPELRKWHGYLVKAMSRARQDAGGLRAPVLRAFVLEQVAQAEKDLRSCASQLGK